MIGPSGKLLYYGYGKFNVSKPLLGDITRRNLGFIAGGTGIAPCFLILQASVRRQDNCNISLLFANHTPQDILMKNELDELITINPNKF